MKVSKGAKIQHKNPNIIKTNQVKLKPKPIPIKSIEYNSIVPSANSYRLKNRFYTQKNSPERPQENQEQNFEFGNGKISLNPEPHSSLLSPPLSSHPHQNPCNLHNETQPQIQSQQLSKEEAGGEKESKKFSKEKTKRKIRFILTTQILTGEIGAII